MGYTDDLTKGKTYSASSQYGVPDYQASNAFDGNTGTNWYAQVGGGVGEWVEVDLGSGVSAAVTRLRMIGSPNRLTDFKLQGSNNNSDWTDVYSGTQASDQAWHTYTFTNTTAYRYYRIYCAGASNTPVNITDIEMMASVAEYEYADYTADLTGTQTYFASSEFSTPDYAAPKAFDDNESNNWYAVGDVGQYVGVDFGSGNSYAIEKLRLLCNPSRLSNFKLQGSNNNSDWYSVYVGQRANNTSWQDFNFVNETAYRYYRILSIEDYYSSNINVTEAEMMEAIVVSGYKTSGTYVTQPISVNGLPDLRLSWNSDTPVNTNISVSYGINDNALVAPVTWTAIANEGVIEMPEVTSDKYLWIKFLLETEDPEVSPAVSAIWLAEAASDPNRIQINLTYDGRIMYPQGNVTINFTGSMTGPGNAFVEPFAQSFTPESIVPFFNPHNPENITVSANLAVAVKEVDYESAKLDEPADQIGIFPSSMSITVIHVGTLPL